MSKSKRETQSARRYALLALIVLAGCSGKGPLRVVHDGSAAGSSGGENADVPGATGASTQGGGSVAIGGAGGTAAGGTLGSSAKDTAPGGAVDASSTHGAVDATGYAISMDGSPGAVQDVAASESEIDASDGWCDETTLWNAINEGAGIFGYCLPYVLDYDDPCGSVRSGGYLVFDGDGRVVDNTGLFGAQKQAWLDGLSTMRWPCYAGQTMQYMCIQVSDDGC
jgi:hypothetical protein